MSSFKSTADILETTNLGNLFKKAQWQEYAKDHILDAIAMHPCIDLTNNAIHSTYVDSKVVKIYCQDANSCSVLSPFALNLLQRLKDQQPAFFVASIQNIEILRYL